MLNPKLFLVFVLFFSAYSMADVYYYAASHHLCGFSASRSAISTTPVELNNPNNRPQYYGLQIFASKVIPPRFTALNTGSAAESLVMFKTGGIPNTAAQINWPVTNKTVQVSSFFNLPGGAKMPIMFTLKEDEYVASELKIDFSLDLASNIIRFLGDKQVPNFKVDPPIVSWGSHRNEISLKGYGTSLIWLTKPNELAISKNNRDYNVIQVQIHYPPEKYNGLSYHIKFFCGNDSSYFDYQRGRQY